MLNYVKTAVGHYVRGLLMGGADVIPGVSGGTVALIVGIYERLVAAADGVFSAFLSLLRGDVAAMQERLKTVEWALVIPVVAGIVTALLLGAALIPDLMKRHPTEMRAVFFGLILGSIAIPWMRMRHRGLSMLGVATLAAVAAYFLTGLPPREVAEPGLLAVFLTAAVAICAMILPGVSGAFLLLVFGMYETTLSALHNRDLLYVAVFGTGAAVGLGSFARLLNWLLEHHHDSTMAALIGLMAGSLRALWPWITVDRTVLIPGADDAVVVPGVLMVAGFVFVNLLAFVARPRSAAEATARV